MQLSQLRPWLALVLVGVVLHVLAVALGVAVLRYPPGAYFAILPERLLMHAMVAPIGLLVGLVVAILSLKGRKKLYGCLVAVVLSTTSYWVYHGIELLAFNLKGFTD